MKFDIGTIICTPAKNGHTQRYIVVDYCEIGNVCVDALAAREGKRIVPFDFIKYYGDEEAYIIDNGNIYNGGPCVEDEYVDEYNLPNEYRLSIKKTEICY